MQQLNIAGQGGEGGTQVMGHGGDQGMIGPDGLRLPLLALDEGTAHIVDALGQAGKLIVALDGDGVLQVPAL